MALGPYRCEARHVDPLAPKGISTLLEVEVSVERQAESSDRCPEVDRRNGFQQSDVGGEERIANELLLKIGIQISPRTIRRYMPGHPKRPRVPSQRWMTFVRNQAKAIIAADFFVVVTASFRVVICC
jgi:hypothetical protein